MSALLVIITDWKPIHGNTLRGYFTATIPSGLTLFGDAAGAAPARAEVEIALHELDGTWCVSPTSNPMLSKDGAGPRDQAGNILHVQTVAFESKTARHRFNSAVFAALQRAQPEIFETEDVDMPLGDR